MYTREIQAPVTSPVINGKPVAGTWTRPFDEVNLSGIARPFSIAWPKWILKLRIKEWQSFIIQNEEVYFETFIANLKFFRFIGLTFMIKSGNKEAPAADGAGKAEPGVKGAGRDDAWEKGEIIHCLDYFPLSFWELPESLNDSWINAWAPSYAFLAHYWLDASVIRLNFGIEAGIWSPEITAMFEFYPNHKRWTPAAANMLFSGERCFYSFKTLTPVRGTLKYGDKNIYKFSCANTTGLFRDYKGYFPYLTRASWVSGFGFDKEGRRIGFSLGETGAAMTGRDNENALWVDGEFTPLPPVRITQPEGIEVEWVIEDVEGMVDIAFTPKKQTERSAFNLGFSAAELYNPLGTFKGFIMTKDGSKISINNISGCAERLYLRM